MTAGRELDVRVDELEQAVLREARSSAPQGSAEEAATLEAVRRRIAALPLTGLPAIDLPPIPSTGCSATHLGASVETAASGALQGAGEVLPKLPLSPWLSLAQVKVAAVGLALTAVALVAPPFIGLDAQPSEPAAEPDPLRGMGARDATSTPSNSPSSNPVERLGEASDGHAMAQGVADGTLDDGASGADDCVRHAPATSAVATPATGQQPEGPSETRHLADGPRGRKIGTAAPERGPAPRPTETGTATGVQLPFQPNHPATPQGSLQSPVDQQGRANFPAVAPRPQSPLTRELLQLRQAQETLQQGDARGAWQLMVDLDRMQPSGALLVERQVTKVLALCAMGRVVEAQSLALRLRESSSGGMYSARLRNTCVSPGTSSEE